MIASWSMVMLHALMAAGPGMKSDLAEIVGSRVGRAARSIEALIIDPAWSLDLRRRVVVVDCVEIKFRASHAIDAMSTRG